MSLREEGQEIINHSYKRNVKEDKVFELTNWAGEYK